MFCFFVTDMQEYEIWQPNWVRLAPNRTNLVLFKISLSTFWLAWHTPLMIELTNRCIAIAMLQVCKNLFLILQEPR